MQKTGWLAYAVPLALLGVLKSLLHVRPCDDAFITLRVAENLAAGRGMVFNPAEYVYICTSPAWTLLIAAGRFLVRDTTVAAAALGSLFEAGLVVAIIRLASESALGKTAGVFAAVLLVTNPVFLLTSGSGMELPLSLTLTVLIAHFMAQRRFTAAAACAGFVLWVRFDGIAVLAATLAMLVWLQKSSLRAEPRRVFRSLSPALVGIASYVAFGVLVFHSWVPMSVRAKAGTAPRLFSTDWVVGAVGIAGEFGKAVIGESAYWYTHTTPFVVLPVFVVFGAMRLFSERDRTLVPLSVLTAAHVLAFVGSGSAYATNFPWYFAPILPAFCLVGGVGLARLSSLAGKLTPALRAEHAKLALQAAVLVVWVLVATPPLREDARAVLHKWNDRERVYASGAVWAGEHLGKHAVVAANEIGAIGYFLPPTVSVLDMFGLLRTERTLKEPFVALVQNEKPDCILTKLSFAYKGPILETTGDQYDWFRFRNLGIGVRADLGRDARPNIGAIQAIYSSISLDREYPWNE